MIYLKNYLLNRVMFLFKYYSHKFSLTICIILCAIILIFTLVFITDFELIKLSQHKHSSKNNTNIRKTNKITTVDKVNDDFNVDNQAFNIKDILNIFQEKIDYQLPNGSNKRLWFLNNGSIRPDPLTADRLALWPDEGDPLSDRITNQLMYTPANHSDRRMKTIYLNADDDDWHTELGSQSFRDCPVNSCALVDYSQAPNADLIFFKDSFVMLSFERPAHQLWLLFLIESPLNTVTLKPASNSINWTATYRHDSDIATPYAKFFAYGDHRVDRSTNYALNKTKMIAWFVSNCYAQNRRLEYARQLQNYIQVDIYGACGPLRCPREDSESCLQMLAKDYKFYLSFENCNCGDYITEKFWFTALNHNVVPIVMGAKQAEYERQAPPNSFIHVDQFETPKQLAEYLIRLDSNDTEYNRYFEWKGSGEIREILMWCRVCALLHSPVRRRLYNDIDHWWSGNNICENGPPIA